MQVTEFIRGYIRSHEGGLSLDKNDSGNWYKGKLVGSKYGVTGAALATFRGVRDITADDMQKLTLDEAIRIALQNYYRKPKIDRLAWNQVSAAVLDMGYNAGPSAAIKLLQRMIGAGADGDIGPETIGKFDAYVQAHGVDKAAKDYAIRRCNYYDSIIMSKSSNEKYRRGWYNRANSFCPSTSWWKLWSV